MSLFLLVVQCFLFGGSIALGVYSAMEGHSEAAAGYFGLAGFVIGLVIFQAIRAADDPS